MLKRSIEGLSSPSEVKAANPLSMAAKIQAHKVDLVPSVFSGFKLASSMHILSILE